MESIRLAVSPGARGTRILGMRGRREVILRARLSLRPWSPEALTALLETLAAWEGARVCAALVADGASTSSSTTLLCDTFTTFESESGSWQLTWASHEALPRGDRGPDGFGDLARLLARPARRGVP